MNPTAISANVQIIFTDNVTENSGGTKYNQLAISDILAENRYFKLVQYSIKKLIYEENVKKQTKIQIKNLPHIPNKL